MFFAKSIVEAKSFTMDNIVKSTLRTMLSVVIRAQSRTNKYFMSRLKMSVMQTALIHYQLKRSVFYQREYFTLAEYESFYYCYFCNSFSLQTVKINYLVLEVTILSETSETTQFSFIISRNILMECVLFNV